MSTHAQFSAVGIVASDMAATLAFYRRLGLDVAADADSAPHAEVTLPGGVRLLFDTEETIRSFHPDWEPVAGAGRLGLAFALSDAAAVDALYAELVGAGYEGELEPFDAFWGQRYATVQDPDGNGVDLFAPLPG
ncbi:VOC family protein [Pseudonocardia humida]|uniref:VOC family protein n=1 Tax=Pseudonocardia humida TaxID=2800819 RepID=A0ABT0ZZ86_9PSEU|nr:VOC family protein [Pseudonocardia humida]MCO1656057.1 VOC family protein [Pseudonocardia humida]